MTIDTGKLRASAQAATPGEWWQDESDSQVWGVSPGHLKSSIPITARCCEEDATFIAAANPQTILALLDEIGRLREIEKIWNARGEAHLKESHERD